MRRIEILQAAFRSAFIAAVDGFGVVVSGLVGAMVALSFSAAGPVPEWYYLLTIGLAVGMALVKLLFVAVSAEIFGDPARKREKQSTERFETVIDQQQASHSALAEELAEIRREIAELRKPWWHRWRRATSSSS